LRKVSVWYHSDGYFLVRAGLPILVHFFFPSSIKPGSIDLLCLPEMIFSGNSKSFFFFQPWSSRLSLSTSAPLGYVFESAAAILPFLEHPKTGVTSQFCASTAQRLRCYVAAGYPERLDAQEVEKRTMEDGSVVDVVGANSAIVYAPDGTCVVNHRKSHLFHMDKPWVKPGESSRTKSCPVA
jgi:protein N-terminal amidase